MVNLNFLLINIFILINTYFSISLPHIKESQNLEIPLKYHNNQFFGEILVHNKPIKVIFDTGSNFLWVQGESLKSITNDKKYYKHLNRLIPTTKFYIKYGTGFITGKIIKDDVNLDSNNNDFKAKDFKFGLASYQEESVFKNVYSFYI